MTRPRRRLRPSERRDELIDVAAELFASQAYDDVQMDDVAGRAGVSRALLYRYFHSKRDLFAAVYRRAADALLARTEIDPGTSLAELVERGMDAHLDYFTENRRTVLAANRTLAGDPAVQAIIDAELAELRRRMLDVSGLSGHARELASASLHAWLTFVRAMCVEWLESETINRAELRDVCLRTLRAALGSTSPQK